MNGPVSETSGRGGVIPGPDPERTPLPAGPSPLGPLVGKNVLFGGAARACELLVILIATPLIARGLGPDRYGLLSLCLVAAIYFGFLDLGMSQALVTFLSDVRIRTDRRGAADLIGTSLAIYGVGVLLGAAILGGTAPFLVRHVFNIPAGLLDEGTGALRIAAVGFPLMTLQAPFRAIILAQHKYYLTSGVMASSTAIRSVVLVEVVRIGGGADRAMQVYAVFWLLELAALAALSARLVGASVLRPRWDRAAAARLLRFGISVSVSSLTSALIAHLDKLVIVLFLPVGVLPYYTVPFMIAGGIWEISRAMIPPVAPALAEIHSRGDRGRLSVAYLRISRFVAAGALHPAVLMAVFAGPILRLWMGEDFAREGAAVLRLLAGGIFVSSVLAAPLALSIAIGRPDIPARIHTALMALTLALCLVLVPFLGIVGAAVAWVAVHAVDFLWMVPWVNRRAGVVSGAAYAAALFPRPALASAAVAGVTWLFLPLASGHLLAFLGLLVASGIAYLSVSTVLVLDGEDRAAVRRVLAGLLCRFRGRGGEGERGGF